MVKLLSLWLAWRAVRLATAVAVIVGVLALLSHGRQGGARHGSAPLTQLRHEVHPVEQQLERTIERFFKR